MASNPRAMGGRGNMFDMDFVHGSFVKDRRPSSRAQSPAGLESDFGSKLRLGSSQLNQVAIIFIRGLVFKLNFF